MSLFARGPVGPMLGWWVVLALVAAGCGDDDAMDADGGTDAGVLDGGGTDGGPPGDAGADGGTLDAGPADAGAGDGGSDASIACVDEDGDGFGEGPDCLGADCDDTDAARWADCDADGCIDNDGDGYGDGDSCTGPDCDDTDPCIWSEIAAFLDEDGDHYGTGSELTLCSNGVIRPGYAEVGGDCDDADPFTYPGAAFAEDATMCTRDADRDGFGDDDVPAGIDAGSDCDDADATRYGTAPEIPEDGVDQDCSGGDLVLDETTTVYVAPVSGCSDSGDGTQTVPKCTISAGVTQATSEGKVVAVAAATYTEQVQATASVFGGFGGDWTRDIDAHETHLEGEPGAGGAVVVPTGANVALQGLVVDGRPASSSADAVAVWVEGSAIVADSTLDGGYSNFGRSVGLRVAGHALAFGNTITGGRAPNDDNWGVHVEGTAVLTGNDIAADDYAIWMRGSHLVASDNTIGGYNALESRGTADTPAWLWVTDNDISVDAGGILLRNFSEGHIARNHIEAGKTGAARAIRADTGRLVTVLNNVIDHQNGGFGSMGMTFQSTGTLAWVAHNTIFFESATSSAVGIDVATDARAILANNLVVTGAGTPVVVRSLGSLVDAATELAGNALVSDGDAVKPKGGSSPTDAAGVDACDWAGCVCATATTTADPAFVDGAGGDLHLTAGSPAIDAAVDPTPWYGAVVRDVEGDARPADGDGDGSAGYDIGADEVPAP